MDHFTVRQLQANTFKDAGAKQVDISFEGVIFMAECEHVTETYEYDGGNNDIVKVTVCKKCRQILAADRRKKA